MASAQNSHISVLRHAVCDALSPQHAGQFLDATFGAGGHTSMLLEEGADHIHAIDQDPTVQPFADRLKDKFPNRFSFYQGNFSALTTLLPDTLKNNLQGALFDLGVSSMQLDQTERGFSFMKDGPLDMRMSAKGRSAQDVIQQLSEEDLAAIFYYYGEERRSRAIAKAICAQRRKTPFSTTTQLANLISQTLGGRQGKTHPATKAFQGLRIYVNQELDVIEPALTQALSFLKPAGRIAVITFHSLEDRLVKRLFKQLEKEGQVAIITKKPIAASTEESKENPRSRSAKLRVAEKVAPGGSHG